MVNRTASEIVQGQVPLTLPGDATIKEACRQMHERRVGAVLVTDGDGRLSGIFTGRDAVRCLATDCDPAATPLSEVMTHKPHAMSPHATAIEALRLMRDGGFRHVPIVVEHTIVGIISRDDFRGLEKDRLEEEIGLWERI